MCAGRSARHGAGQGIGRATPGPSCGGGGSWSSVDAGAAQCGRGGALTAAGGDACPSTDDVSTVSRRCPAVAAALRPVGRVDAVVNNAASPATALSSTLSEDDWDAVLRVHLKSTFLDHPAGGAALKGAPRQAGPQGGRRPGGQHRLVRSASAATWARPATPTTQGAIASIHPRRGDGVPAATAPASTPEQNLPPMTRRFRPRRPGDAGPAASTPARVSLALVWLVSDQSADVTGRIIVASGKRARDRRGLAPGPTAAPVADPTSTR